VSTMALAAVAASIRRVMERSLSVFPGRWDAGIERRTGNTRR
jgi:hypothetical protein